MQSSAIVNHGKAKYAELASGLGAIALGGRLALLLREALAPFAVHLLMVGLVVHGAGMTLKYRWDIEQRSLQACEQALFWLCWLLLAALVWIVLRIVVA